MIIGIPKECFPGERRVALVPALLPTLAKAGMPCLVETGAGGSAGFPDAEYRDKGATLVSRDELYKKADLLAQVRTFGANQEAGREDLERLRPGQMLLGFAEPLDSPGAIRQLAQRGVVLFAMELVPRITRAQGMDALSSMATIAGYKAVLLAAGRLPKMFPMLMTAAGTVAPAQVFVMGVGVAGLQAIATARRLGAVVSAYDVRPAVKDQVQSVGAKFVEVPLDASESQDAGGYAKALGEEFYKRQRELLSQTIASSDVVITTAAVPGKKAPILITGDMVARMRPGSVIVDLVAERGGNCELTREGESTAHGVTILGTVNLPATVPFHASQMYAKNVVTFLQNLVKDGTAQLDSEDEIIKGTLTTRGGSVVHPRVLELSAG